MPITSHYPCSCCLLCLHIQIMLLLSKLNYLYGFVIKIKHNSQLVNPRLGIDLTRQSLLL